MTTVTELQRAAQDAAKAHERAAAELRRLTDEAAEIRERLDAANLASDAAALAIDGARLQVLDKAIAAQRPQVEQARCWLYLSTRHCGSSLSAST